MYGGQLLFFNFLEVKEQQFCMVIVSIGTKRQEVVFEIKRYGFRISSAVIRLSHKHRNCCAIVGFAAAAVGVRLFGRIFHALLESACIFAKKYRSFFYRACHMVWSINQNTKIQQITDISVIKTSLYQICRCHVARRPLTGGCGGGARGFRRAGRGSPGAGRARWWRCSRGRASAGWRAGWLRPRADGWRMSGAGCGAR